MEFAQVEQKFMMTFYNNNDHQKFMNMGRDHVVIGSDNNQKDNKCVSEESTCSSSSSLIDEDSKESSSSSLDLLDDASSSSPNGPLNGLSNLMDQLPIKRGLSKFYQGKSQSYTSLARVTCLEDLAKKETPYQKRLKSSMSYGGGLNNSFPKNRISKKVSNKGSLSNLSSLNRKNSFVNCLPPSHHVQTTF